MLQNFISKMQPNIWLIIRSTISLLAWQRIWRQWYRVLCFLLIVQSQPCFHISFLWFSMVKYSLNILQFFVTSSSAETKCSKFMISSTTFLLSIIFLKWFDLSNSVKVWGSIPISWCIKLDEKLSQTVFPQKSNSFICLFYTKNYIQIQQTICAKESTFQGNVSNINISGCHN